MAESKFSTFVDRRDDVQRDAGLATHILFWYDKDRKGRRRTNGMAVTTDGFLLVARSICSKKDQFMKPYGRMVVTQRMLGTDLALERRPDTGSRHSVKLSVEGLSIQPGTVAEDKLPEMIANAYEDQFPGDPIGQKRAFNAGKIFVNYRTDINQRAEALLDDFDDAN